MTFYDEIAAGYDELYGTEQVQKCATVWNALTAAERTMICKGTVLDIGAGTGIAAAFFQEKGVAQQDITCVDPAAALLDIARARLPNAAHICSPAEHMQVSEHTSVISFTAVQNFSDSAAGLLAMRAAGTKVWIISVLKKAAQLAEIDVQIKSIYSGLQIRHIDEDKDTIYIITASC